MAAVKQQPKNPCPVCRTSERGDLRDDELGGHVCDDCAKWGKVAEIRLRSAGIVGCTRVHDGRGPLGGAA
jgi:hypothetical protein